MIYENDLIYVEQEVNEIPWVKIFTKKEYKEISDCEEFTQKAIFKAAICVEKTMISFYNPDKINMASFANYLPRVHLHVMARFKNDNYFPECMWGKKQRDAKLNLPSFDKFSELLNKNLKECFEKDS
ncbi:HIT family protein [Campylobacter sputorum]|uniref:HIT family protein n=1 Tax=Campylobacter sputorum TaxID=206 RepID=UPI00053BF64E|nr:HIT family protein [Campylobacter sputorum]